MKSQTNNNRRTQLLDEIAMAERNRYQGVSKYEARLCYCRCGVKENG